jgi:Dynamin family
VIKCGSCRTDNEDDAVFCVLCGRYLEWTGPVAAEALPSLEPEPAPVITSPQRRRVPDPVAPAAARQQPAEPPAALTEPRATEALAYLERVRSLTESRDRADLSERLVAARTRLERQAVPVAVVGEFKRGKSTLVNALLQRAVCPVDADIVTAVPTLVRFGDRAGVTAYTEPDGGGEPVAEEMPVESIENLVSEQGPASVRRYRSVEVRLPHRMLRSGLCLVDTPGVGGLDSAHGLLTLSALDAAAAMIFVTDASQELTAPELEFLRQAVERCPLAACVITKTDLYVDWRKISELDQGHLQRAELDLDVIAVSSFLRLRARREPALNEESGFRALVHWLAATVVSGATEAAAVSAAREVRFVVGQVGRSVEAERAVLAKPQQADRLVAGLTTATQRSAKLVSATATWQQLLTDRVQDLVADVEHDLQESLRRVLRDVETVIDQGDPKVTWTDIEVWLRRRVIAAAIENYDSLSARAAELAADVAGHFDLEAGVPVDVSVEAPADAMEAVGLGSSTVLDLPGGRIASLLITARTASFLPMVLFGAAGSLLGVLVAPLSLALGAGIGAKIIRDERQRQVTYRRQQAKVAARKYVDEIAFLVGKDSRDALRQTQRQLRDAFQSRAASIHRSTEVALDAAERASRLAPPDRAARAEQLAAESGELRALRAEASRHAKAAVR